MTRNVAWLLVIVALATPVFAGGNSGSISGFVKNSAGVPQMGAVVEVFGAATLPHVTVFTDARGYYEAALGDEGVYQVKVTAPSFLPALRENVSVRSGAAMLVNVTLNTLFEAIQLTPKRNVDPDNNSEDWKWTLRTMANRPVLRVLDDGPVVVSHSEDETEKTLKARVAFIAGSEAQGTGGAAGSTVFDFERSMFTAGTLSLNGNVAYDGQHAPATVLRAAYRHAMANGSTPELALTARRFALPFAGEHNAALQALAVSASNDFHFFDFADVTVGTEYQAIQALGRAAAFKPFGTVTIHAGDNTVIEYGFASTQPTMRAAKGFDTAPADLSESGPRMSMRGFDPVLERARHHEIAVRRRLDDKTTVAAAVYHDSISDPAVIGVGDVDISAGEFMPDIYSGTFTVTGQSINTSGLRLAAQRKLMSDITVALDYAFGGVLDVEPNTPAQMIRTATSTVRRHSLAGKVSGTMPATHTRWITSYRWTDGRAVTPVDAFNASFGQTDPYFNVFLRQPMPTLGFLPKMEALVDVRNLLAQGYVPVLGSDGRTLYLVQSARALRGGVSFSF